MMVDPESQRPVEDWSNVATIRRSNSRRPLANCQYSSDHFPRIRYTKSEYFLSTNGLKIPASTNIDDDTKWNNHGYQKPIYSIDHHQSEDHLEITKKNHLDDLSEEPKDHGLYGKIRPIKTLPPQQPFQRKSAAPKNAPNLSHHQIQQPWRQQQAQQQKYFTLNNTTRKAQLLNKSGGVGGGGSNGSVGGPLKKSQSYYVDPLDYKVGCQTMLRSKPLIPWYELAMKNGHRRSCPFEEVVILKEFENFTDLQSGI